jgi:hypothetical protein
VNTPKPAAAPAERRLRFSDPMLELYEDALRDGPLTPILGRKLARHVAEGTLREGIQGTALHRATMAVAAFHLWCRRYEPQLRPVDPAELLESGD